MTHEEGQNHFDPGDFPALREFFPAYLHEDFGEEYGSAAQAMAALRADAGDDQIHNVRKEWKILRQQFAGHPLRSLQRALGELGAAWQPQSERELQAVDEILSRTQA
jgi:hypothetical protein